MKRILALIFILALVVGCATVHPPTADQLQQQAQMAGANKVRAFTALTGGGAGALDAISVSALTDGDRALVSVISGTTVLKYDYIFDADGTDAEASPKIIRPDDYASGGNWRLIGERVSNAVIGDPDSWTPTTSDYYSGRFIASATGTFALPALAAGMGFSLSVDDTFTVTVNRNGSDTFTLTYLVDGTPTQATSLTSLSIVGPELCVFSYRAANEWEVQCGDNTTGS